MRRERTHTFAGGTRHIAIATLALALGAAMAVVLVVAGGAGGSSPVTRTYSSGAVHPKIPNPGTVIQKIHVPDNGEIKDVNARVRLSHGRVGDVTLILQHPFGRTVLLAANEGGDGGDYGGGTPDCDGDLTSFSDEAAASIADDANTPPFVGAFRPEQALTRLDGKRILGDWRLIVADSDGTGTPEGMIHCAILRFRYSPRP